MINILNPSRDARTISPGSRLKNFLPTFEFVTELVRNPVTLTTPERTPFATFSVILLTLLTLHRVRSTMFKRLQKRYCHCDDKKPLSISKTLIESIKKLR